MAGPRTGAEAVLMGLKTAGVDWLFANAGTDFPPVIEALSARGEDVPVPVTAPHETAAVGMAHGYYLVTGRPQAVMVHVNVGLANAAMGVINAAADNVPLVMMSGRTPLTEVGRPGHRVSPIHYGQEMFDQTAVVRGAVKYDYELRYPEQGGPVAMRAVTLALSDPKGPVYLSLPREPLMEACDVPAEAPRPPATPAAPDPAAVAEAAAMIRAARAPVLLCQRGDPAGRLGPALSAFATRLAIPVCEPFPVRNVLAGDDPMLAGYDPGAALDGCDLAIVLDSSVPWIEASHGAKVPKAIHIGPDPHFGRMPVRGYRTDLAITADPLAALAALEAALAEDGPGLRRAAIAERGKARRTAAAARAEAAGTAEPMGAEWLALCLSRALGEDGIVFNELGTVPGFMDLEGPNRLFTAPHSGGLGWGFPAALGAQLARPGKLTVACIGDGSYLFANPPACHQIAEALGLPVLVVVKNNGMWNAVRRSVLGAFPQGAAARANVMPLTSLQPQPDFCAIARASRAHAERVERGADLPAALERALAVIRDEGRQALLDVQVAAGEGF